MRPAIAKSIPFRVAADSAVNLTDQVVAGLRTSIQSGYYQPGDRLPTLAQSSAELGVSLIVVRRAIAQLAAAGWVVPQHGRGIIAAAGRPGHWRAHLAHIHWSGARSYFHAVFNLALHEYLQARAVLPLGLLASPHELEEGFPAARTLLETQPVTLALVDGLGHGLIPLLTAAGVPFVHFTHNQPSPAAALALRLGHDHLLQQVAKVALATASRSVLHVSGGGEPNLLTDLLQERGVGYRLLHVDPRRCLMPEQLSRTAYQRLAHFLAPPCDLPDLIFFDDDVVAVGGLLALLEARIRIPEQTQVVTWANRGQTPLFPLPLARFEFDPGVVATQVGEALLAVLQAPLAHHPEQVLLPRFVPGATLRVAVSAHALPTA